MKLHNTKTFSDLMRDSKPTATTEEGSAPAIMAEEVPQEEEEEDPYARGFRIELDRRAALKKKAKFEADEAKAKRAEEDRKWKDAADLKYYREKEARETEWRKADEAKIRRVKNMVRDAAPIVSLGLGLIALAIASAKK